MRLLLALTLSSAFTVSTTQAARILAYFPVPAPSHHFFFQPFLLELATRGHQIDYYSPMPLQTPHVNITLHKIEKFMKGAIGLSSLFHQWRLPVTTQSSTILYASREADKQLCRLQSVRELLSSDTEYDMIIHEELLNFETGSVLKHKFKALSVSLIAVGDLYQVTEMSGLTVNPSYMVHAVSAYSDSMGFFERLHNAFQWAGSLYHYFRSLQMAQKTADECYTYPGWESRPPITRLLSDQALILVNSHPSVGFSFPKAPHVKEVGGAALARPKPLPQNIRDFINGASEGVILFSLGSVISMDREILKYRDEFSRAFSKRKERVLWKWNFEDWDGMPSNVMVSEWFPQQDILAHKSVKLFITHGGIQSAFEAVNYGVPLIVIPSFGDQVKNSLAIAQKGYGLSLKWDNITESTLDWAVQEVLGSSKYKQRVSKGSEILKDQPKDLLDEGVYWIEYVLRHGNVLQPQAAQLSFIQLHCLDIFGFILMTISIVLYLLKKLLVFVRTLSQSNNMGMGTISYSKKLK